MSGIGEFYVVSSSFFIDGLIDYSRTQSMFELVGSSSFSVVIGTNGVKIDTFKPNEKVYTYYRSPSKKDYLVSVGYVDSVKISGDGSSLMKVSMRDESAKLFDCSWINEGVYNGQYNNVGLTSILNSIIERYVTSSKLLVRNKDVYGSLINIPTSLVYVTTSYEIDNNSTPFDSIKALGDKFNFIMYSKFIEDKRDEVLIKRYNVFQIVDTFDDLEDTDILFKSGVNIKKYEYSLNYSNSFSEYNAKGQSSISDTEDIEESTTLSYKNVVSSEFYRPTSVNSSDGVNQEEIKKLCNRRILADGISSKSLTIDVAFSNLVSNGNKLLLPGQIVGVFIEEIKIDGYYVIADVSYDLNGASIGLISANDFSTLLKL